MAIKQITCPSGLVGTIRSMKGREAKDFSNQQLIRTGASFDRMLEACWVDTVDPGIYAALQRKKPVGDADDGEVVPFGRLNWERALMGDRFHTLLEIRDLSFPDIEAKEPAPIPYEFEVKCKGCGEQYGWEVSLADLERKELPEESKIQLLTGQNRFETFLDTDEGRIKVVHKLGTGFEEKQIPQMRKQNRGNFDLIDAIAVVMLEIEGTKNDKQRRKLLEECEVAELFRLIDRIQEPDCGVKTDIETVCEMCGWQQDIQLPFEGGFFLPKPKKTPGALRVRSGQDS